MIVLRYNNDLSPSAIEIKKKKKKNTAIKRPFRKIKVYRRKIMVSKRISYGKCGKCYL